MSGDLDLEISASLDVEALAREFAENGRIHIPDFLAPSSAAALRAALDAHNAWSLTFIKDGLSHEGLETDLAAMEPSARAALNAAIMGGARAGFQYLYRHYGITDAHLRAEAGAHRLDAVQGFVNSDAFLTFMRTLTNDGDIVRADVAASGYGPGHFLLQHDDVPGRDQVDRRAAFVLNMTQQWRRDWGGYLMFYDEDGNVIEGYRPTFNALNVFKTPQRHGVSYVAPFAKTERRSLAGWVWVGPPGPLRSGPNAAKDGA